MESFVSYTVVWKIFIWNIFVAKNIQEKFSWFSSTHENILTTNEITSYVASCSIAIIVFLTVNLAFLNINLAFLNIAIIVRFTEETIEVDTTPFASSKIHLSIETNIDIASPLLIQQT